MDEAGPGDSAGPHGLVDSGGRVLHSVRRTLSLHVSWPQPLSENVLPTLFRFLMIIGTLAAIVWAGMFALVTFVEPQPREMTQTVPSSRLNK
ncbi:MAG: histidine kinase [Hyphomicrobiales bacterium]|nr:histidine kinase [Hyphomicrobiales bacterium]